MRGYGEREEWGRATEMERQREREAKAEREGGGLEPPPQTEKGIQP